MCIYVYLCIYMYIYVYFCIYIIFKEYMGNLRQYCPRPRNNNNNPGSLIKPHQRAQGWNVPGWGKPSLRHINTQIYINTHKSSHKTHTMGPGPGPQHGVCYVNIYVYLFIFVWSYIPLPCGQSPPPCLVELLRVCSCTLRFSVFDICVELLGGLGQGVVL